MLARSLESMKQALMIETGKRRSLWHKNVSIAVLIHNATYHASTGCEPIRLSHGRIPFKIADLKKGICLQQAPVATSQNSQDVLDQIEMIYQDVCRNAMQALIKHKAYYNKKINV